MFFHFYKWGGSSAQQDQMSLSWEWCWSGMAAAPSLQESHHRFQREALCFLYPAQPSPQGHNSNIIVSRRKRQVLINLLMYVMDTYSLALQFLQPSLLFSSGTTNITFGSTCYNFTADPAKRNTLSTWTFEILRSANTVRNSDKFVVLFKVHAIQIVITCSLYLVLTWTDLAK